MYKPVIFISHNTIAISPNSRAVIMKLAKLKIGV